MFISAFDFDISRCVFADNEAASGGALYMTTDIFVDMENCTFAGNAATNAAVSMLPPLLPALVCCAWSSRPPSPVL